MNIDRNSDMFQNRHLGLKNKDEKTMLKRLGFTNINDFLSAVIPHHKHDYFKKDSK